MSTSVSTKKTPRVSPSGQKLTAGKKKSKLGWNVLGVLVAVVMGFPVYWMFVTAVRPGQEILSFDQKLWPTSISFDSFSRAMEQGEFWANAKSSVIIAGGTVLLAMGIALVAAYAIARFRFAGRKSVVAALILVQMLPATAMLIPIYIQLNNAGLLNEYIGVIVVYAASTLPFAVVMLRGFIINIPRELEEAAMVDGTSQMGAFWRVVFPLLAPGLVATAIYSLITAWNEYLFAYIVLQDNDMYTLSVWLLTFTDQRGTDHGALMAGSILVALPVVIFFLIVQRKVAAGLTAGAVKG